MQVHSSLTHQTDAEIVSQYIYKHSEVEYQNGQCHIYPKQINYTFKTEKKAPKLGVMLIGWGGNNGSTVTGGVLANKHNIQWMNKKGVQTPNYYGSVTQCSTTKVGCTGNQEVYLPLNHILPLVDPNEIVLTGWDISKTNLAEAMLRAEVFDYNLIEKLTPYMKDMVPMPSIYQEDFIAENQKTRADNVIEGDKQHQLDQIRENIRSFKNQQNIDKVIVLWTANTERFSAVQDGVHDNAENLLKAIREGHSEISPSTIFAVATILEDCSYVNGSPQNTFVPGVIELAKKHNVFIVGDDFKSGQTKIKTSLTEFLVGAGLKPRSIVSYNHLGNNDGKNLSQEEQFKSKEMSKKSCVDDILASNKVLYPDSHKIDHEIIIKYVPYAGDSKKAMDEYCSEIFMGGQQTHVLYNVCEDSLLAAPIILDLIILTELFERIQFKTDEKGEFKQFNSVLSTLGYLCKAPLTDVSTPLVNALSRQKNGLENLFKICAGIPVDDNSLLEFKCPAKRTQRLSENFGTNFYNF